MCQGDHAYNEETGGTDRNRWDWKETDIPPDWETIPLPPDHILKHRTTFPQPTTNPKLKLDNTSISGEADERYTVTDAHCHPTDLEITKEEYDHVKLGGIGAMATVPEDQAKVYNLGSERGCSRGESSDSKITGPRVVSCFGGFCIAIDGY